MTSNIFSRKAGVIMQRNVAFAGYRDTTDALADPAFTWQDAENIAGMLSDHGRLFELNFVGVYVWDLIDGNRSVNTIIEMTATQFGADPTTVGADIRSFLGWLSDFGLIVEKNQR